jgi:hypothetical protein
MITVKLESGSMPLKYGWAALRDWTGITGKSLQDLESLGSEMTVSEVITLIWVGFKQGARVEKVEFTLSEEEVADLMDDNPNLMNDAMKEFAKSMSSPNPKAGNRTPRKKKRP